MGGPDPGTVEKATGLGKESKKMHLKKWQCQVLITNYLRWVRRAV